MAQQTDTQLRGKLMYSVFVRNHTPEGTFQALERDLDRIAALGTDIIWLLPIHPIGEVSRKGTLGSPYAIRDYRGVNPEYGTLGDLMHLVAQIHERGMKCIIDVVYNHTSPDSVLAAGHPEFFLRDEMGRPTRRVAEWSDIVDLDYRNLDLWKYQIETLKIWAEIVDGFRCDVASSVPAAFWREAREQVMLQIWADELDEELEDAIVRRQAELEKVVVIFYDAAQRYETRIPNLYCHGFEQDKLREWKGRWLLLETDGQEMIYAGFSREQMTEAIYTRNFHMTLLACECIRHDAYCTRLRMQLPPEAREVFGDDMEGIRDVFDVHGKYNANRPQGQKEDA